MLLTPRSGAVFAGFSLLMLLPALLPGTADVNVWNAWVEGLNRQGFVAGFNQGDGHILQPPLGLLLVLLSHNASPWLGLHAHVWPAGGLTGYDLSLWLALVASSLVVLRITRNLGLAVLFQVAFALNSVVYAYFDIYGAPCWLLGMHAVSENKLARGFAHDTLSGYAMNLGWIMTWAMHVRWPESYGPLQDGLIEVIRTRDTRVLGLMRVLFYVAFGLALWRQWRRPNTAESMLPCMLAGYLAYFLFNKGAHENHLVPAMLVAGYMAWRERRWLPVAVALAILANLNMFFFYGLDGMDRGTVRVVWGIDWSLPLAVMYVGVVGLIYLKLCGPWATCRSPGHRDQDRPRTRFAD